MDNVQSSRQHYETDFFKICNLITTMQNHEVIAPKDPSLMKAPKPTPKVLKLRAAKELRL